jgi:hypothetical protein
MSRSHRDDTTIVNANAIFNFLHHVWRIQPIIDWRPVTGWMFIAIRDGDRWKTFPIDGSKDGDDDHIKALIAKYAHRGDFYFCPTTFKRGGEVKKEHAHRTPWLHCDIDEGDLSELPIPPSILWSTSPGRHQALWLMDRFMKYEDAEAFNRTLAKFSDDGTGWQVTKYLRVPGSINFKRDYDRPRVKLLKFDVNRTIREYPARFAPRTQRVVSVRHTPSIALENRLLRSSASRYMQPAVEGKRSNMVCGLVCVLHKDGYSRDDIVTALLMCPSFIDKRGYDASKARKEIDRILEKSS